MLNLRMKRSSPLSTWARYSALIAVFAAINPTSVKSAAPDYGPSQEESGFGTKVGGFFRSLFYGESSKSRNNDAPPPPQRGKRRNNQAPSGQSYNLDAPPISGEPAMRNVGPSHISDTDTPPPPARTKESTKPKTDSKTKPRATETLADREKVTEKKKPERSSNVSPTLSNQSKPAPREVTTPVTVTNNTPPSPPPVKEKEPEVNTPPAPRNTPGAGSGATEEAKVAQNTPPISKPPVVEKKEVLTATKTANPARVKSPYPPFTELDVAGLPSGSSALDPTCQRIFRVP